MITFFWTYERGSIHYDILVSLILIGRITRLGTWYWLGLAVGAIFFAHHLWLIRNRDRAECFRAFLGNHYFGMSVFAGILLNYIFK